MVLLSVLHTFICLLAFARDFVRVLSQLMHIACPPIKRKKHHLWIQLINQHLASVYMSALSCAGFFLIKPNLSGSLFANMSIKNWLNSERKYSRCLSSPFLIIIGWEYKLAADTDYLSGCLVLGSLIRCNMLAWLWIRIFRFENTILFDYVIALISLHRHDL